MAEGLGVPPLRARYFYFYRVGPVVGHHREIDVFLYDASRSIDVDENLINQLYADADIPGKLPRVDDSDNNVIWRHRSILIFALRDMAVRLKAVAFFDRETAGNHSFSPLRYFSLPETSGVYCLNERISRRGDALLAQDQETFDLGFNFDPPEGEHRGSTPLRRIIGHNESGTNTGP